MVLVVIMSQMMVMIAAMIFFGIIFVCAQHGDDNDDDDAQNYCTFSLKAKNTPNMEEEAAILNSCSRPSSRHATDSLH